MKNCDRDRTAGIEGAGGSAETTPGAFDIGDRLLVDGQVYDCTALTPFWSRRQGREISLATLASLCPNCGITGAAMLGICGQCGLCGQVSLRARDSQ